MLGTTAMDLLLAKNTACVLVSRENTYCVEICDLLADENWEIQWQESIPLPQWTVFVALRQEEMLPASVQDSVTAVVLGDGEHLAIFYYQLFS